MRTTFDPDADALYLSVTEAEVEETREAAPNVMIDLDASGRIVGVEILGVSKLPTAKPTAMAFEILAQRRNGKRHRAA